MVWLITIVICLALLPLYCAVAAWLATVAVLTTASISHYRPNLARAIGILAVLLGIVYAALPAFVGYWVHHFVTLVVHG